ncbi:MAG: peptidase E [Flavobacteriaceae bacterium]|nr:peptidase E [Bacteroidia bacterium]NNF73590.1 peptidase E [Flavobacteriaceae bacterium]NNK73148.1 peptidase E [Flavobacteriaceae bacterium]
MNLKKYILLVVIPLMMSVSLHKFYVSVTQVEFIPEKESIQIISRIFIDDFERLLNERYDESLVLASGNESPLVDVYTERYMKEKISILIDGKQRQLSFIGKEYEDDIMFAYLEIEDVIEINSFEISNEILFELFDEQQNIVRTTINDKRKSFILVKENAKGLLNFD